MNSIILVSFFLSLLKEEEKYESSDFKRDVNFLFAIPLDISIVIKFVYQGG